ncbi:MAG: hypothetical protein ACPGOY_05765 [Rhodospirillaceae bacterium]
MSSVTTPKVTGPIQSSGFASAATSRVGDVRGASSGQFFNPIGELNAALNVASQDRNVRQDDLNGRFDRSNNKRGPDGKQSDGVKFGNVLATNDFSQTMFELQSQQSETPPPLSRGRSRTATDSYEFAVRAIDARATGERPSGNNFNRIF